MHNIDLNIDLHAIPQLSYEELRAYYDKLIGIPTTSTRKEYYIWRVTNKLQEMRFGGLDNKIRRMLENMDTTELFTPQKFVHGTEIIKQYKGATYKIRVVDGGGVLHCVREIGVVFQDIASLNLCGWFLHSYYRVKENT
jgi:hypothetical protein